VLPNPEVREVTFQDYLKIMQKRSLIILACLVIIPFITTVNVFIARPMFKATASIAIEKSQVKVTKFDDVYKPESDPNYLQTQYKILNSRALVEIVFNELRLSNEKDFKNMSDPIGFLSRNIKVEPIKNSNVVLLSVEDFDPLRAASIANSLAKAYIQQDIENRNRKIKDAGGWLDDQLSEIRNKIKVAEEALNKYVQDNKLVLDRVNEQANQNILSGLRLRKSNLELAIAENSKRYKDKHPKMIALKAELESLDNKIKKETVDSLTLRQQLVQYNMLKKEVDSNQELYISLLARSKETDMSQKLQSSNIRLIDPARPPEAPFKPQKVKSIVTSLIFALLFGGGIAFLLEYIDSTIRTAEDVSTYVNLPFLGYLPTCSDKDFKVESEKYSVCSTLPTSQLAESFRALRTSLLFSTPEDKPLKTILVTSALPGEGKSFCSANLSWIFARLNEKVVLIDVDMRRPKINKMFNIEQTPGLSTYLTGNAKIDDIIHTVSKNNVSLSIIPSGAIVPNPTELLSSAKITALISELSLRFNRIILDSPPILIVADTSLLANMVDGVILLIKGAHTRLEAVLGSKKKIAESKGKVIGAVINNVLPEKEDSAYYYHYYSAEADKNKKA